MLNDAPALLLGTSVYLLTYCTQLPRNGENSATKTKSKKK